MSSSSSLSMLSLLLLFVVLCTCTGGSAGLVLQYFDAKGVIETARVLARVGGLNMEDVRYSIKVKEGGGFETPEFTAAKVSGALAPNMDRAPLLKIGDDCTIGQSRAIERYIARRCNLYGSSDEEAAVIDCVVENTRDIKDRWGKIRSIGGMGPNDEKTAAIKKWYEEGELAEWLGKLERSLPAAKPAAPSHFSVGGRLSYSDVTIWHLLRDCFDDADKVNACAADCKRLRAIADHVAALDAVKTWLAERPKTMF